MSFRVRVKICGITRAQDVREAAHAGANFVGIIVEVPRTPRSQTPEQAQALFEEAQKLYLHPVAVTVDMPFESLKLLALSSKPYALQLHGDEPTELVRELRNSVSCRIWKAIPVPPAEAISHQPSAISELLQTAMRYVDAGADAIFIDTSVQGQMGGTGKLGDWEIAKQLVERLPVPCILSGGLNPDNVLDAIQMVKPWCVDSSSGVEIEKGIKDAEKVRLFVERAKSVTL